MSSLYEEVGTAAVRTDPDVADFCLGSEESVALGVTFHHWPPVQRNGLAQLWVTPPVSLCLSDSIIIDYNSAFSLFQTIKFFAPVKKHTANISAISEVLG